MHDIKALNKHTYTMRFPYSNNLLILIQFSYILSFVVQWGTWRAGVSVLHSGIRHPDSVMKNIIPIVMAGGMSY